MTHLTRRRFLQRAAAGLALPGALGLLPRAARAQGAPARRLIVFYFPDGVPGQSQDGDPSAWHPDGGEHDFALPELLAPLRPHRDRALFFRGLSMGDTDNGSHPGGAQKLLTAVDRGNGESIDRLLARTIGADAPHRHLYLGVQANHDGASGDKHISYVAPGATVAPEDDPVRAFGRLFGEGRAAPPGAAPDDRHALRRSVLDTHAADLADLRARVTGRERARLELHLDALRELERRLEPLAEPAPAGDPADDRCADGPPSVGAIDQAALYAPAHYPALLRAQTDLIVTAMACGLTRVGVIQNSHHTTDLMMSAFPQTPMAALTPYMRSHEASHYGARHDLADVKYASYVAQRRWFVEQFADLLDALAARPEGDGTLLDHTLVLLCTEVCDGNTHQHHDMPFILAGGQAAGLRGGRLIRADRRHGDLYAALARLLGHPLDRFGDAGAGPLPGLT